MIVAAGLDSRAIALNGLHGTTVFEIDQPKVLDFKARVLGEQGAAPTATGPAVAADLRTDWAAPLKGAGSIRKPLRLVGRRTVALPDGRRPNGALRPDHRAICAGQPSALGAFGSRLDHDQLTALETGAPRGQYVRRCGFLRTDLRAQDRPTPRNGWPRTAGIPNPCATRCSCRPATG